MQRGEEDRDLRPRPCLAIARSILASPSSSRLGREVGNGDVNDQGVSSAAVVDHAENILAVALGEDGLGRDIALPDGGSILPDRLDLVDLVVLGPDASVDVAAGLGIAILNIHELCAHRFDESRVLGCEGELHDFVTTEDTVVVVSATGHCDKDTDLGNLDGRRSFDRGQVGYLLLQELMEQLLELTLGHVAEISRYHTAGDDWFGRSEIRLGLVW